MKAISRALGGLTAGAVFALALGIGLSGPTLAQIPSRIAFQISTGTTGGTYFSLGELLTGILSHPPGIGRCMAANVCGPAGLIVTARGSEGSVANVLSVNAKTVTSGLAQGDVVALAVAGEGPFKKAGPAKGLRVVANLFGEDLHLLAATNAKINSVSDLRGKRVSLSTEGSGTIITARAVLSAYGLSERSIKPNYASAEQALDLLRDGKLDAMFLVEGTPASLVEQALLDGKARLVPVAGTGRTKLLARQPYLSSQTIPAGTYGKIPAVETIGVDALWITNADQPDDLIYGIVKALYHPTNRAAADTRRAGAHFLELGWAGKNATAPLHAGTVRYLSEAGFLKQRAPEKSASMGKT